MSFFTSEDNLNDSEKNEANFIVFLKIRMVQVYDDDDNAYF